MSVIEIATKIQQKIDELDRIREKLIERGNANAKAISDYEKQIALTLMGLRNGEKYELENKTIADPPATVAKEIAKGICWKEKLAMETAEMLYKSVTVNLGTVQAQLNGYQTINRYLDNK